MNERLRKLVKESDLDVYGLGKARDRWEYVVEKFAHLVVQECIEQLETGKKCDPYTGSLFTCDHNDNIDYQIKVLKEHFEMGLLKFSQTHVHASDTLKERVNKTAKNEHEDWYGQWQWECGYERGWDKAVEREWAGLTDEEIANIANECRWSDKYHLDFTRAIEAKLKEKNT